MQSDHVSAFVIDCKKFGFLTCGLITMQTLVVVTVLLLCAYMSTVLSLKGLSNIFCHFVFFTDYDTPANNKIFRS